MFVLGNVIKPQGLEPLQFPTKFRAPSWMEWMMDKKYPEWRNVKRFEDGSAQVAPAGLRVLERVMVGEFGCDSE